MKTPGSKAYDEERKASDQEPQEFLRPADEERFEATLFADLWYVWPVLGALTSAWVANAAPRWPVDGASALLEVAAFTGLAAQQVASRSSYARYSILFLVWGALACIGTPTGWGAISLIYWLAGGVALAVFTLVIGPRTRTQLGWLVLIICIMPWMQSHELPWGIKLTQSILAFIAIGVVLFMSGGEVGGHAVRIWQRIALAGWIIIVFPSAAHAGALSTLALAVAGLAATCLIRYWLLRQRTFAPVVALWMALHLLGLRTADGPLAIRIALIMIGFLLLVVAGWRFGEASLFRWPRSIFRKSPLCFVPRLDQSRDHPLKIDAL